MKYLFTSLHSALHLASLVLSTTLLSTGISQAQVQFSPTIVEVQSSRGQAKGVINITNASDETFRARVYAEYFTYDKEKGFQAIPSNPNNLIPYLQFSPRELVIPPGTTRKVRMSARLAPNLPNGEYRAMIFTEPLNPNKVNNLQGTTAKIITRVGGAFFVRKGDVSPSLRAESVRWNVDTKKLQILVRNTGKASTYSSVKWSLKQGGKLVKTGENSNFGIVPESDRYFTLSGSKKDKNELVLSPGTYQLSGEVRWGDKREQKSFNLDFTVPSKKTILLRNSR